MTDTLLRIDASARTEGSTSRALTDRIAAKLAPARTVTRDLSGGLPLIDASWIAANFTPEADRTDAHRAALALSDDLIAELKAADTLLIGVPVYNFGVPTGLKAWVDQVARAGVTFRYTEAGPEGLLTGKRAIIAYTSAGTPIGSEIDFASGYLRHILGFLGITDVSFVAADRLAMDRDAGLARAQDAMDKIAA